MHYMLGAFICWVGWQTVQHTPPDTGKERVQPFLARCLAGAALYFAANSVIWLWRHAQ